MLEFTGPGKRKGHEGADKSWRNQGGPGRWPSHASMRTSVQILSTHVLCAVADTCNPSLGGQVGTGDPYNLLATRLTELVSYIIFTERPRLIKYSRLLRKSLDIGLSMCVPPTQHRGGNKNRTFLFSAKELFITCARVHAHTMGRTHVTVAHGSQSMTL